MALTETTLINGTKIIFNNANNATMVVGSKGVTISDVDLIGKFCEQWSVMYVKFAIGILLAFFIEHALYRAGLHWTKHKKSLHRLSTMAHNIRETLSFFLAWILFLVWLRQ